MTQQRAEVALGSAASWRCCVAAARPARRERFPPARLHRPPASADTDVPAARDGWLASTSTWPCWPAAWRWPPISPWRGARGAGCSLLTLVSLAWLGFCREGCICPIGAIQNVALALFDPGYAIPLCGGGRCFAAAAGVDAVFRADVLRGGLPAGGRAGAGRRPAGQGAARGSTTPWACWPTSTWARRCCLRPRGTAFVDLPLRSVRGLLPPHAAA